MEEFNKTCLACREVSQFKQEDIRVKADITTCIRENNIINNKIYLICPHCKKEIYLFCHNRSFKKLRDVYD